jgi:hypothetical protein
VVLFLLLALFSARTAWGDETSALSAPSTPEPLPLTISGWQAFDEAWATLKDELTASATDSEALLILLQNLQTEVSGLQSSLQESNRLLQLSGEALALERQKAMDAIDALEAAIISRNIWRGVAGLSCAIAAVSILALIF